MKAITQVKLLPATPNSNNENNGRSRDYKPSSCLLTVPTCLDNTAFAVFEINSCLSRDI